METVLRLLVYAIEIYSWALIIYILLSWFPGAKESTFGDILARICEPYLEPFRRFIPPLGMIDISPLVAIFTLKLATNGLVSIFRYFL
ncbi:TPA: YggT family protein [Bacillus cereus]|uniref:YggT family protein n=1 Tax=Bacillus cereus TaxID=1396 RepID=A0A1D3NMN5_BACCE|nr:MULTISPECIES: YggT family protein [Bacillus]MCG3421459.1 YggT family protein [Bacillus thuringiensis]MCP1176148.1 YggT family protein [Bacillus sp. 1663tsa1]MCP1280208.1 YggT family protein [Bacillus sp. S0635]MCQ6344628.1 YggT family protein [Bacillus cereus]MCU5458195.1 YggT family protein [Bacillus cereus]